MEHQHVHAEEATKKKTPQEELAEIGAQYAYARHVQMCSASRKERAQKLMNRRSAAKWSPKKKQQMVRRLSRAVAEHDQASEQMLTLELKAKKLGAA